MYFWDNYSNSCYWAHEKKRKNLNPLITEWWIVKAKIKLDNMLDLTDQRVLMALDKLWSAYCKKHKCSPNQPLGKKINMLFDYFENLKSFKVIRGIAKYPKTPRIDFLYNSNECYVINDVKTIYCIRNGDEYTISNRVLEEVI